MEVAFIIVETNFMVIKLPKNASLVSHLARLAITPQSAYHVQKNIMNNLINYVGLVMNLARLAITLKSAYHVQKIIMNNLINYVVAATVIVIPVKDLYPQIAYNARIKIKS